mgnify:CR=1 FL=1
MLLKYLENIRKRPPEARKRFALAFSIMTTVLIVAVWGTTLLLKSIGTGEYASKHQEDEKEQTLLEQFQSANQFTDNVSPVTTPEDAAPKEESVWNTDFDAFEIQPETRVGTTSEFVPYSPPKSR